MFRWTSTWVQTYSYEFSCGGKSADRTDRLTEDWLKQPPQNTAAPTSSTGRIPDLIHNQLCRHSSNVINCRITALYYLHKLYIHLDLKDSLTSRQTQATHISKHHSSPPSPSQVGPTQPTWPHAKQRLKINYPNPRLYTRIRICVKCGYTHLQWETQFFRQVMVSGQEFTTEHVPFCVTTAQLLPRPPYCWGFQITHK